jgi:hypothetical protein
MIRALAFALAILHGVAIGWIAAETHRPKPLTVERLMGYAR